MNINNDHSIVYNRKKMIISTLFKPLLHVVSCWVVECSSNERCGIYSLPGRCLLMIFAVSVALAMLEWIRTSYLNPSAASLWPVNSAWSRPESGEAVVTVNTYFGSGLLPGQRFRFIRGNQDLMESGPSPCHCFRSGCTGSV